MDPMGLCIVVFLFFRYLHGRASKVFISRVNDEQFLWGALTEDSGKGTTRNYGFRGGGKNISLRITGNPAIEGSEKIITTSAEVTPNGGLVRESTPESP